MTWKEVKESLEAAGLKDEDEVAYIDIHPIGTGCYPITKKGVNGWEVYD